MPNLLQSVSHPIYNIIYINILFFWGVVAFEIEHKEVGILISLADGCNNVLCLFFSDFRGGARGGSRGGGGGSFGGGGGGGRDFKKMQPGEKLRKPRWDMDRLQPFEKNFYKPHPNLVMKPQHEVEAYRAAKEITTRGRNIPHPIVNFNEASFPDYVTEEIR